MPVQKIVVLTNNVKDAWRKRFIQERPNAYEVDAAILMHPRVWEASGHVASFSDPLIDCKGCKMRHRVDNLIDDFDENAKADGMTQEEMMNYIREKKAYAYNSSVDLSGNSNSGNSANGSNTNNSTGNSNSSQNVNNNTNNNKNQDE